MWCACMQETQKACSEEICVLIIFYLFLLMCAFSKQNALVNMLLQYFANASISHLGGPAKDGRTTGERPVQAAFG